MTLSKPVVVCRRRRDKDGWEGGNIKKQKKISGVGICVHYLDCDVVCTDIYTYQTVHLYAVYVGILPESCGKC